MPLPKIDEEYLPDGIHSVTVEEFVATFANVDGLRQELGKELLTFHQVAQSTGALYYLVGGSFLSTENNDPQDLDIITVYQTKSKIPDNRSLAGLDQRLDMQFASEDEPEILGALVTMFRTNRTGRKTGICIVNVSAKKPIEFPIQATNDRLVEVTRNVYKLARIRRQERVVKRGIIVTIHGIRTHAPWNSEVARFGSSQGWTVAPFIYGYKFSPILLSKEKRSQVVDSFRRWLDGLIAEEGSRKAVSVVAHSLGTYILASYLFGFDNPPHKFNGIVLTGSILDPKLDWQTRKDSVKKVLHERAPNDPWATKMRWFAPITMDPLFGNSGSTGFKKPGGIVDERTSLIFDHNNQFNRDVIRGRWIPFLNAYDV